MQHQSGLRRTAIRRVLYRHNLFMSADRELGMTALLCCFALAFIGQTLISLAAAILVWTVGFAGLRLAAKADPLMRRVYLRHLQYRPYYAARSRPYRTAAPRSCVGLKN